MNQNLVRDGGGDGFSLASEMGGRLEDIRLHNNIGYHNHYVGLTVSLNGPGAQGRHPMAGIAILNNTFVNNGWEDWGGGIALDNPEAENVVVANNVCSQNRYFQIVRAPSVSPQNAVVDCNLVDGFRGTEGEIYGSNSVRGSARFVNAAGADFHLRASSPALDAGTNHNLVATTVDWDEQIRVFNGRVDIGADEAVVEGVGAWVQDDGVESIWNAVLDARCQPQRCFDLTNANWSPWGDIVTCQQPTLRLMDTNAITARAFYRLVWIRP